MEITPIGWLLIPLGVILFVVYPEGLYALTIFFVPFTATSILNSGSGDTGSGIQPFMFFGLLLLLQDLGAILWRMKFRFVQSIRTPVLLYGLFLLICGASLIMPILINGKVEVPTNGSLSATVEPLLFDYGRLKIFFGLIFEFLLTISVARRNLIPRGFVRTSRIYVISGVFVCLWGLLQFVLYLAHIPYPYMIFNNSASPNAQGYKAVLDVVAMRRVSSVALEPSTLAVTLVGIIPLLIIPIANRIRLFGKHLDRFIVALLFITLVLTTSATGYLGFGALCLLLPFSVSGLRKVRQRILIAFAFLASVSVAAYFTVPVVRDFVQVTLLDKSGSYSALERWVVVSIDFQYFRQYPFLGIGWGSAPTHDTVAGILSSCGLLGLLSFTLFIGYIVMELRDGLNIPSSPQIIMSISGTMFLSISATIAAYVVSGLPGGGTFCVIAGMAIAAVGIGKEAALRNSEIYSMDKAGFFRIQRKI